MRFSFNTCSTVSDELYIAERHSRDTGSWKLFTLLQANICRVQPCSWNWPCWSRPSNPRVARRSTPVVGTLPYVSSSAFLCTSFSSRIWIVLRDTHTCMWCYKYEAYPLQSFILQIHHALLFMSYTPTVTKSNSSLFENFRGLLKSTGVGASTCSEKLS